MGETQAEKMAYGKELLACLVGLPKAHHLGDDMGGVEFIRHCETDHTRLKLRKRVVMCSGRDEGCDDILGTNTALA
jgi:hypothetical protein